MSLVDLIPGLGALRALGIALMVGGASTMLGGFFYFQPKGERIGEARVQARWDSAELRRAEVARKAELEARAEEQRRTIEQREALDEAQRLAARSRADAARAADAGRLFIAAAIAGTVSGSGLRPKDPAAGSSCSATGETAVLSADVLGRLVQRSVDLARFADDAHDAGITCERSYDALTPRSELTVSGTAPD